MKISSNKSIKLWFKIYIDILKSESPEKRIKIEHKAEHSVRVSKIIKKLGRSKNMNRKDIQTAEIAGLLHDIGKIKQYSENPSNEEDQAAMGKK